MTYDAQFYENMRVAGESSPEVVLPLVLERTGATSALDVGCGIGLWAAGLERLGVADVVAVDGAHVPEGLRKVTPERFVEVDLGAPFSLGRRFDLVLCLEVAEHLHESRAAGLVADLCSHGDLVLFSAATPGQGGVEHVNEQWLGYWIRLFAEHGYVCCDVVRPKVRYDERVAWIYRQNCVLFCASNHPVLTGVAADSIIRPVPAGAVEFEYVARYVLDREAGVSETLRGLPRLAARAVSRRLRRR